MAPGSARWLPPAPPTWPSGAPIARLCTSPRRAPCSPWSWPFPACPTERCPLLDPKLLQLRVQLGARDAEPARGFGAIAVRVLQRLADHALLEPGHGFAQREPLARALGRRRQRRMI